MAYTVGAAFQLFYDAINLSGDHRTTSNTRKDRIVKLLEKDFTILDAFGTGSIPKYTALRGHADLDIFVVLHWGKHVKDKTPTQLLQDVRDALGEFETNVRKNGQAVTLYYKSWPNVDIVPVSRVTDNDNVVLHYNVPNLNDGSWIKSKPRLHSNNIAARVSTCGENFRKIIKFVKWWNLKHGEYLRSYHIEVMALGIFDSDLSDLSWNILKFFQDGKTLLGTPHWHEEDQVDKYLSTSDKTEVIKRFDTAIAFALKAWHSTYGKNDDHEAAIMAYRSLFGDKFPSYG